MKVNVKYMGVGSSKMNSSLDVDLQKGSTVKEMINSIETSLEVPVDMIFNSGIFLVNNKKVTEDYILSDGDMIRILRVLGGG